MELSTYPTVREALLFQKLNHQVRCHLCERRCLINQNQAGFCQTRTNINSQLYTLTYGDLSALESRPIEIKPFFHYHPGTTALTFSTWSCNFRCPWCQNHSLSRTLPAPNRANFIPPEDIVKLALKNKDAGICVSLNEPTLLFEYSCDVFQLARSKGLYNCIVSNGYMTEESLKIMTEAGLDGIKIDIKGDERVYKEYCGHLKAQIIWRNAQLAKKLGLWVEMVNLIITGVNDSQDTIQWVINNHLKYLDPQTPLHFTRYFPAYKFHNPPTPIKTLEKAYQLSKAAGILYPYLGNVHGHPFENTHCHNCQTLLIQRYAYQVTSYKIVDGKCYNCGTTIPIISPKPT